MQNCAKEVDIHAAKTCELPEDGQELRTKHVGAIKILLNQSVQNTI